MSLLSLTGGLEHGLPVLCLMFSRGMDLTRRVLLPFSLAALLVSAAAGQDSEYRERLERFQLFNACRPMNLTITLADDKAAIGLTKEALQAAVESRLRAARLYTEDYAKSNGSWLFVNVLVVGRAFNITVLYHKMVTDEFGVTSPASTWGAAGGITGTHGGDAGYIVSSLSRHLDKFLAEYLRVNEAACNPAPPSPRTP
ncbi:MAG: hypothetical protein OXB98_01065 [Bryobacterales bacterium]|nr:hypothetical protein [Bryobacterales bacterium]